MGAPWKSEVEFPQFRKQSVTYIEHFGSEFILPNL